MHTNEIYSEYVSKGVNAKNITNAQLGTLYLSAKADANEILSSKKVTTDQKNRATNILDALAIVEKPANATMQANGEIANAVNVDGQAKAEIGQTVDQQSDSGYNDIVSINENNGGNVNGSTNTELLERGEVSAVGRSGDTLRQQGENSRKLDDFLRDDEGSQSVHGKRTAGASGWAHTSGDGTPRFQVGHRKGFLRDLRKKPLNHADSAGRRLSVSLINRLNEGVTGTVLLTTFVFS